MNYVYINCHGGKNGDLLIGSHTDYSKRWVTPVQLRSTLDQVPGKIVLIVEACYCGVLVDKSAQSNDCINTFMRKFKTGSGASKAGELKGKKYNVLCASSKTQYSYGCVGGSLSLTVRDLSYYENDFYGGLFTYALGRGCGWNIAANRNSAMMADANRDNKVTFGELALFCGDFLKEYFDEYIGYDDDGSRSNQTPVFYSEDPNLAVFSGNGAPPAPTPTPSPKYRGVAIGVGRGKNGDGDIIYMPKEAEYFSGMLLNQSFDGQKMEHVNVISNPASRTDALKAIEDAFEGSNENDVNYIYIRCRGGKSASGKFYLWLAADDNSIMWAIDLRRFLDQISGKTNLILICENSGDAIDKGMSGYADGLVRQFVGNELNTKSGEFINDKYNVICACSKGQINRILGYADNRCWDISSSVVSEGAGWVYFNTTPYVAELNADSNGDKKITMREIYDYAEPRIKEMHRKYNISEENGLTQLCVYPYDDSVIFARS